MHTSITRAAGWTPFTPVSRTGSEFLGVNARIWRDGKLRGDDRLSDEVLDQLKRSALLISIVSPNGVKSNWCEKERQKFEQYAEANIGFRIGNAVRAFKVVMTPAEGDTHRPLFDTIGYKFFEKNPQTGHCEHYLPTDSKFEKLIDQLAQDIKARASTTAAALCQVGARECLGHQLQTKCQIVPDRTLNWIAVEKRNWSQAALTAQPRRGMHGSPCKFRLMHGLRSELNPTRLR